MPKFIRPVAAWFGFFILAFANGALREVVMKQLLKISEPLAHQLSCLTGVTMWTIFALVIWHRLRIQSLRESVWVGFGWLVATALFETFVLNRNLSWTEIRRTYDFTNGEFWGLVLLWIGLMPVVIYGLKTDYLCMDRRRG